MKCYKLLYDYENDRNYIDCDKAYIGKLNEHCMNKGIRVNVNSDIYFEYDSIEGEVLSDYIANVYGWFVVSELFVDTVLKCFDCKKLQIFPIAVIDRSNKKKTMSCSVINVLDVIDKAIDYDKSIYDIFCVGEKKYFR